MDGPQEGMANRIEQAAREAAPPERSLLPFARDADRRDDLVDLHRFWDLASPPEGSEDDALHRQTQFNAAATRLITCLAEENAALTRAVNALEARVERLGGPWAGAEPPAA